EALPLVELEVSQGGRTTTFSIGQVDFLVGTVPGCDLRVPGTDLAAVLFLLARHPGGVSLRKLAPTQTVVVNGQTVTRAELGHGDRITVGTMDLLVRIKSMPTRQPAMERNPDALEPASAARRPEQILK